MQTPSRPMDRFPETDAAVSATPGRRSAALSDRLRELVCGRLAGFPWQIVVHDWTGKSYSTGGDAPHWRAQPLVITFRDPSGAEALLAYDPMAFLDRFLEGAVDMEGNLYLMTKIKYHADFRLSPWQALRAILRYTTFQTRSRAKVNVKSHYDIPQEALNVYLDQVYKSYSCGMFERPEHYDLGELLRIGEGEKDAFDSLEKAQWRKFKDAVDFIAPERGETLLDVGCGYGGQLIVGLENHAFGKVVGWTHSANQKREGEKMLAPFEAGRWELNEGDYREDDRVFDHVTSTGMISHVGPRGLVPYVRNVRRRIKTGGRYLHHALMNAYSKLPHDADVGLVFNKKYVWPGFHWFTVGSHVRALEQNGFQVVRMTNLSPHYAKTTAAWYERMMDQNEVMVGTMGEPTFRAWQIFLAGVSDSFLNKTVHVYRIYCEAV